jgi:hypothetical protein
MPEDAGFICSKPVVFGDIIKETTSVSVNSKDKCGLTGARRTRYVLYMPHYPCVQFLDVKCIAAYLLTS